MARYLLHVRSPLPPAQAFDYMADLNNFALWDPGVERVEQVVGDGVGADSAFDVTVKAFPRPITLRYATTTYEPPDTVVVFADGSLLTSLDTITVSADGDGSIITYDAELELKSVLGLADPLLGLVFQRIGDRATAGLIEALEGERIEEPAS